MGQYKVPQNVEAEDHIIGPLTMRQFVYAVIGVVWAGLMFEIFHKVPAIMIVFAAPVTILFLLLAFYKRDGQDFEHFLAALTGYFGHSRQRVWIKEPVLEAFKLVPPPVVTAVSQRNPAEVRSQFDHLANLMDTQGGLDELEKNGHDDRLFLPTQPVEPDAAKEEELDILDPEHSPGAHDVGQMIEQAAQQRRTAVIEQVQKQAAEPPKPQPKKVAPHPTTSVMTPPVSGDIIRLATENNDLKVSQIAAQANRMAPLVEGQSVNLSNAASQSR